MVSSKKKIVPYNNLCIETTTNIVFYFCWDVYNFQYYIKGTVILCLINIVIL